MAKKIVLLFLMLFSAAIYTNAAEPKNNLNKTFSQLQREFPDLIYWCDSGRGKYYKSGDELMFEIKNDKVICEFMLVEGPGNFPHDWFVSTVNAFSNTNYKNCLPSDGNAYTFFYSYFTVYINYDSFQNNSSITYELFPKQ